MRPKRKRERKRNKVKKTTQVSGSLWAGDKRVFHLSPKATQGSRCPAAEDPCLSLRGSSHEDTLGPCKVTAPSDDINNHKKLVRKNGAVGGLALPGEGHSQSPSRVPMTLMRQTKKAFTDQEEVTESRSRP